MPAAESPATPSKIYVSLILWCLWEFPGRWGSPWALGTALGPPLIDSTIVIFVNICIFSKLFMWKIHLSNQNIRFCTRNTILVPSRPHFRQISLILDPLGPSWSSKRFLGRLWGPPRDPLGAPRESQTTPWELQEDPKRLLGSSKMLPRDSKWRHFWPPGPYQKSTRKYDTKMVPKWMQKSIKK